LYLVSLHVATRRRKLVHCRPGSAALLRLRELPAVMKMPYGTCLDASFYRLLLDEAKTCTGWGYAHYFQQQDWCFDRHVLDLPVNHIAYV